MIFSSGFERTLERGELDLSGFEPTTCLHKSAQDLVTCAMSDLK